MPITYEIIRGEDNGNPPDSLRQMYPKINRNFTATKIEIENHEADDNRHWTSADRSKMAGIEPGAEPNQNAFAKITVPGEGSLEAESPSDEWNINGLTGITVTVDEITRTIYITATGEATPGAHASSHITGGTDVIPNAVPDGNAGLMSGSDKAALDDAVADVADVQAQLGAHEANGGAHGATTANTPSAIVRRDGSGAVSLTRALLSSPNVAVERRQSAATTGSIYDLFRDFAGNTLGSFGFTSGASWQLALANAVPDHDIALTTEGVGKINIRRGSAIANVIVGSGSPEGAVSAVVGSIYMRTNGGASTTLYLKESGSGNTGWKAVQTA